jgi:hypothetical protein
MTHDQALAIGAILALFCLKAAYEIIAGWLRRRRQAEANREAIRRTDAEMLRNKEAWKHFNHQIHEDTRPAKIER